MKKQLLVVENDTLMAEAVADYFTGEGWEVQAAGQGLSDRRRDRGAGKICRTGIQRAS